MSQAIASHSQPELYDDAVPASLVAVLPDSGLTNRSVEVLMVLNEVFDRACEDQAPTTGSPLADN